MPKEFLTIAEYYCRYVFQLCSNFHLDSVSWLCCIGDLILRLSRQIDSLMIGIVCAHKTKHSASKIEIGSMRVPVWIFILIAEIWWLNEKVIATKRCENGRRFFFRFTKSNSCAPCESCDCQQISVCSCNRLVSQWWLERFILRTSQAKRYSNTSKLDAFEINNKLRAISQRRCKRCGVHRQRGISTVYPGEWYTLTSLYKFWPMALIRQLDNSFERCWTKPNRNQSF